jgi:glycosyltransferase involved in cell wall biosynthesis
MKICFFGIYDPTYSRNDILLSGLHQIGIEVIQCRADWRDPKRYLKLWKALRKLNNDYDCVYAAYPSPIATVLARLVSRKPVICDAFYSMFDCVVNDRREISWWHPKAIKLLITDWLSIVFANVVITDTKEHRKYWASWWGLNDKKIHPVYLGADNQVFFPLPAPKKDYFLVHWHGTYIPIQGVERIIDAARICSTDPKIRFRFIGSGAVFPKVKKQAEEYKLQNIEFIGRIPPTSINKYLAEADIVLGLFGDVKRTLKVVPNKVYEGLAAKKAVMNMDTPAIREIFSDEEVLLVNNKPDSIAEGIKMLIKDEKRRFKLANNGYNAVFKYFPIPIAKSLVQIILEYLPK